MVDLAVKELHRIVPKSVTDSLPIVGADGYHALVQQIPIIAADANLSEKTVVHLLDRYGSLISEVLDLIADAPDLAKLLVQDLPYLRAEIYYAASHEGARSVEDVIARRTRLAFEAPDDGVHLANDIAEIIAPVLGWNDLEKKNSINHYRALVAREQAAVS